MHSWHAEGSPAACLLLLLPVSVRGTSIACKVRTFACDDVSLRPQSAVEHKQVDGSNHVAASTHLRAGALVDAVQLCVEGHDVAAGLVEELGGAQLGVDAILVADGVSQGAHAGVCYQDKAAPIVDVVQLPVPAGEDACTSKGHHQLMCIVLHASWQVCELRRILLPANDDVMM